jgi:hypothetical protein
LPNFHASAITSLRQLQQLRIDVRSPLFLAGHVYRAAQLQRLLHTSGLRAYDLLIACRFHGTLRMAEDCFYLSFI